MNREEILKKLEDYLHNAERQKVQYKTILDVEQASYFDGKIAAYHDAIALIEDS